MKMFKTIAAFMAFCAGALSLNAAAADLFCTGTVDKVLNYANGDISVHTSYQDFTHICNIKTARSGIDPLVCANWVSQISNALAINNNAAKITVYYPSSSYTCATLPTYANSPAPGYVGVGSW